MRHVTIAFANQQIPLRTLRDLMLNPRLKVLPQYEGQLSISPFRVILWKPSNPCPLPDGTFQHADSMSYWRFVHKADWS